MPHLLQWLLRRHQKPAGVSRGVSEGSAGCEKPEYPREALMNEEQGTVRIRVLVDTSGKVIDAKVKKNRVAAKF